MAGIDVKSVHMAEKSFDKLVSRLHGIEAGQRNCILYAGIVGIEGNDVIHTHVNQFLKSKRTVEGFPHGTLMLTALIQIGHNDRDAAGFTADCGNGAL